MAKCIVCEESEDTDFNGACQNCFEQTWIEVNENFWNYKYREPLWFREYQARSGDGNRKLYK
jgi:hypothetical protein